ncbi:hypothetical protein H2198_005140 [Neophaeococcomyces mojaviensis]|uniref:Uncharacterized protein n=1 Tax=Neophaeococcomyces mojaviensis TaxID=3383035 RepID=A0ACC3A6W5_9EURO|nr:hypothetical protein H2198_005140 [Knufia sp. JES_112]
MGFIYSQLFVTPHYPVKMYSGQTVIVTGSNTGLGKEATRHFVRLGAARVIMAVRNLKAGEAAKADIVGTTHCDPNIIEVWSLDLSSNSSVKAFSQRASTELERIDVLMENAGVAGDKFILDEETGQERMIAVNVIRTFLLALLMLPKLKESAKKFNIKPRLTIVSSEVHGFTKFEQQKEQVIFDSLKTPEKVNMSEMYPISKLLEVLVVREIAPKLDGTGVILNMLNPGLCHSELSRDGSFVLEVLKFFLARKTEVGSRTLLAAAEAGPESHGKYMHDGLVDDGSLSALVKSEDGKKAAAKVWKELSEILETIEPGVTGNL